MLGTCWTPGERDETSRMRDLQAMRAMGLEQARFGESMWSRIEPRPNVYDFDWPDGVLDDLEANGLRAVLALPTARPPRWLREACAEVHPSTHAGTPWARAGEEAHPCVSVSTYIERAASLTDVLARRYGTRVAGFELDGRAGATECGCAACAEAFRDWLRTRFGTIEVLNDAWAHPCPLERFEQIAPPRPERRTCPAHRMDYQRFRSHQAARFMARLRTAIASHAPHVAVCARFGRALPDTDLFAVSAAAGGASTESFPLLWSELLGGESGARTGHPDAAAFRHDLCRGAGRGRWRVSGQQCGAVTGEERRIVPAAGMIRLWSWEAVAHGAEGLLYAPWFEQPDTAGLVRADGETDQGYAEAARVARELEFVRNGKTRPAPVALVFDAAARWTFDIEPWGVGEAYLRLVFDFYEALRRLGLDIDVVGPDEMPPHPLVVAPSLPVWPFARSGFVAPGQVMVVGPRTASRTPHLGIDAEGIGEGRAHLRAVRGESLPSALQDAVVWEGRRFETGPWREWIASDAVPVARFTDGEGAVHEASGVAWIGFWPSVAFLIDYLEPICARLGIETLRLPPTLRLRRRADLTFAFNYAAEMTNVPAPPEAAFFLGSRDVSGRAVTAWRAPSRAPLLNLQGGDPLLP